MIHFILFVLSFIILWKSSDYFVDSSHSLALHLNLPHIVVGATVVAFGTSAPELFVTGFAANLGQADVLYGNIFGSNIANLLLIFGLSMILTSISFTSVFRFHMLTTVIAMIVLIPLLIYFEPSRLIAVILLVLFFIFQFKQFLGNKNHSNELPAHSLLISIFMFLSALFFLVLSSRLLVYEVSNLANLFGISPMFLSLFAVAFGTSLPELVTTIRFIKKGHTDIVIGNVFGSNLFNIAFVLPFAWLVSPLPMPVSYFNEIWIVLLVTLIIALNTIVKSSSWRITGWLFVLSYSFYILFIYLNSKL